MANSLAKIFTSALSKDIGLNEEHLFFSLPLLWMNTIVASLWSAGNFPCSRLSKNILVTEGRGQDGGRVRRISRSLPSRRFLALFGARPGASMVISGDPVRLAVR